MQLPIFQGGGQLLQLLQNKWSSIINPILANPANQSSIISNVLLINGTNTINHLLGRPLIGWKIVRQRASASIYDKQDSNQRPNLTLVLVSDAICEVDIEVF